MWNRPGDCTVAPFVGDGLMGPPPERRFRIPGDEPATRRCSGLGRERNDEGELDEVESRGGDVVRRTGHGVCPPAHRSPVVSTRATAAVLDKIAAASPPPRQDELRRRTVAR